jgi:hypothetical protein
MLGDEPAQPVLGCCLWSRALANAMAPVALAFAILRLTH